MTIDTQEEIIIKLQEKVLSLKKKQRSANQSQSQQSTKSQAFIENHTWRESFWLYSTAIITSSSSFQTHLYSLMKMNQHETAEESR